MSALDNLRAYQSLAPWDVQSFARLISRIADAASIRPTSGTARRDVSPRTIRFYVTRALVDRPEGNGPSATYRYRHLLQTLTIKMRQMDGFSLDRVAQDLSGMSGDVMERKLAAALGDALPHPTELSINSEEERGRAAHVSARWHTPDLDEHAPSLYARWHRVPVTEGVEIHVHEGHPLADHLDDAERLSEAFRRTMRQFLRTP